MAIDLGPASGVLLLEKQDSGQRKQYKGKTAYFYSKIYFSPSRISRKGIEVFAALRLCEKLV